MDMLKSLFGNGGAVLPYLYTAIALVLTVIVVIFLCKLLFSGRIRGGHRSRNRQPRLGKVDAEDIGANRQLVLVRRDNVEHLIMIGGPNDLLIESGVMRVPAAQDGRGMREMSVPDGYEAAHPGQEPAAAGRPPAIPSPPPVPAAPAPAPASTPVPVPVPAPAAAPPPQGRPGAVPPPPADVRPPPRPPEPAAAPVPPPVSPAPQGPAASAPPVSAPPVPAHPAPIVPPAARQPLGSTRPVPQPAPPPPPAAQNPAVQSPVAQASSPPVPKPAPPQPEPARPETPKPEAPKPAAAAAPAAEKVDDLEAEMAKLLGRPPAGS